MMSFLTRRLAYMALTLLLVSFVAFIIIQAAPGDYAEIYAAKKAAAGAIITQAEIEATRVELGLDKPWYEQYWPLGLERMGCTAISATAWHGGGRSAK